MRFIFCYGGICNPQQQPPTESSAPEDAMVQVRFVREATVVYGEEFVYVVRVGVFDAPSRFL